MNMPTKNESGMPDALPLYTSPVLQNMKPELRPSPAPACETCPLAMWFLTKAPKSKGPLKCFCSKMHQVVWDGREMPIMECDGRELAIVAMMDEAMKD